MKSYAKKYCEIKAGLSVEEAALDILRDQLRARGGDGVKLEACRDKLQKQERLVEDMQSRFSRLERELKILSMNLSNNELKVFTLHYIKGYPLKKISKKLYFSYARVKQIHRQIKAKTQV